MKKTLSPLAHAGLFGVALLITGCGERGTMRAPIGQEPVVEFTAEEQRALFPMVEGARWVYDVETVQQTGDRSEESTGEIVFEMSNVRDVNGGQEATLRITNDAAVTITSWRLDDTGLYQLTADNNIAFEPPQPIIPFPANRDHRFSYDGRGPSGIIGVTRINSESRIVGVERVDAPLQEFRALAINQEGRFVADNEQEALSVVNTWWAPNVGLVRLRNQFRVPLQSEDGQPVFAVVTQTLRLKEHNLEEL